MPSTTFLAARGGGNRAAHMRAFSAKPDPSNQLFTEKAPLNLRGFGRFAGV
jgi:hypothetical protein